ncbi:IMP dehydrogenase [Burkholderia gladioli]|uniref:Inosine-5'-monophosphate dehydrogenase n=1 Tax=Burkholderia gladioli TaxID=28095 RepID=A0AAW3FAH1_BURGA|nr:IMP dehydrogenase [Burkholderia gladioli]KGC20289.1 inosine-5'-monophosphate dehydrogenase [Burkholderia gladioli]MBU9218508.1 IMP dehydrogenase [Burkholderia gladioli]MDN7728146.1 IMP dehydrogenase [Burkholderia gladioli]
MRSIPTGLTYDDVLIIPSASEITPRETDLTTRLSRNVSLNLPLVSAAMDTVTESPLAIAIAQLGGIGIIHKNLSVEAQAREVARVKRFEAGVVREPMSVGPETSLEAVRQLVRANGISGFPVVESGGLLIGVVTGRDLRFAPSTNQFVREVMTPLERLVTVREGESLTRARALMHEHRLERVIVVNEAFELRGIITAKDITKSIEFPNACKDAAGRLRVGAAIGVSVDDQIRFHALVEAGVDVVVVDTAHGHSRAVFNQVRWAKSRYPHVDIVAGNIVTGEAALALVDSGADAVKVGMGPGSICTTRVVAGVGVPQLSAVMDVAEALTGSNVPIIADGGIRFSGDVAKALVAGASSVMVGSMFAGTDESPGDIFHLGGRPFKSYRGMGSVSAMQLGSAERYAQSSTESTDKLVPEGIEGRVEYKGALAPIVFQLMGGLRASMGYCGTPTIQNLQLEANFIRMSRAGMRESHVHDVQIVKEAPNYRAA